MLIYPALDLLDGKCVRLLKGDFEQKTIYSDNPLEMVRSFEADGAQALHLVDLSGAKNPSDRQLSLIQKIVEITRMAVQCGGGIRQLSEVEKLLDCGVDRVVLGSIAVSAPALVKEILTRFGPDRITLAIDVWPVEQAYRVAVQGWKELSSLTIGDLISTFEKFSLTRILCTDISRDGIMAGPNLPLYQSLLQNYPTLDFQASGGMSKDQDIADLIQIGVKSVVIGKALYEGQIILKDILRREPRPC